MVCALPSMTKDESQIMSQESTLLTTHTGANLKSIKFHTVVNTLSIFSSMIGSNQHQLDNVIGQYKHSIPVHCLGIIAQKQIFTQLIIAFYDSLMIIEH